MIAASYPLPGQSNLLDLCHLALAMMETVGAFVFDPSRPNERIQIRLGFHCGPVVASVVGTTNAKAVLVGDVTNTASRMESNSIPGRIQLSSLAAMTLMSEFEDWGAHVQLVNRGFLEIKGKGTYNTFFLLPVDAPIPSDIVSSLSVDKQKEYQANGAKPSSTLTDAFSAGSAANGDLLAEFELALTPGAPIRSTPKLSRSIVGSAKLPRFPLITGSHKSLPDQDVADGAGHTEAYFSLNDGTTATAPRK